MMRYIDRIVALFTFKDDPVYHCKLYKDNGCSHVDGFLCDFPICDMNREYVCDLHNEYIKKLNKK